MRVFESKPMQRRARPSFVAAPGRRLFVSAARAAAPAALSVALLCASAAAFLAPAPARAGGIQKLHDERVENVLTAATPRVADPTLRMALLGRRASAERPASAGPLAGAPRTSASDPAAGQVELLLIGEPAAADVSAAGAQVVTEGQGFRTVRVPLANVARLGGVEGVRTLHLGRPQRPELDVSVAATGALTAHGAAAPPYPAQGVTGKGVVLGTVDTGIDWTHGDFKDATGRSRIAYLWDQTDAAGPQPPLYPYGTEWSRTNLGTPGVAREVDVYGHGTHVAGIAAGNGAGTGNGRPAYTYVGMAPEAEIVSVKTDFSVTGVVDGVNWIFQKAALLGKDAVVNLSLGSNYGPHDGTDPEELALDALSGSGRLIVKSAGNTGGERIHGRVDVAGRRTATLSWTVTPYTPSVYNYNYFDLDVWYSDRDSLTVTLMSPNGQLLGPVPVGYYTPTAVETADGALYVENGVQETQNTLRHLFVEVWDPQIGEQPAAGTWTLRVDNARAAGVARLDAWLAGFNLGDGEGSAGVLAGWDPSTEITTPGNGHRVICVGAYTTKSCWNALGHAKQVCYVTPGSFGSLAFFSSPGPTLDGRVKPDICAPGFGVASTLSGSMTSPDGFTVEDGVHMIDQGTSMASPHVAGALCLMLQKRPHMGPSEALSRLALGAVHDSSMGAVPNNLWGYGRLDVSRSLATPVDVQDGRGRPVAMVMRAGPNPFQGSTALRVAFPAAARARVRILDVAGRCVRTLLDGPVPAGPLELTWDGRLGGGGRAPSGIYWAEARQGEHYALKKLGLVR